MKRVQPLWTIYILLSLASCRKLVEIPEPKTQVSAAAVFSDIGTADAAVAGLYSQLMRSPLSLVNGGLSIAGGLLADDITTTAPNFQFDPFRDNSLSPQDYFLYGNFWREIYATVYHANSIVEGLQQANGLDNTARERLTGEARMVRTLSYFYLVNLYGPVPLVTTTGYEVNAVLPQTAVDSVYRFLVADLLAATRELPASYSNTDRFRPTTYTAQALLARVYLYTGNYEAAAAAATAVINGSGQSLLPATAIASVFSKTSSETLWQLPQVIPSEVNTTEGESFIPAPGSLPQFVITGSLLNSFEPADSRRTQWIDSTLVDGTLYFYPLKYRTRYSPDKNEHTILFRLPELYLIRAEAHFRLGRTVESLEDLNTLRLRAGLPVLDPSLADSELAVYLAQEYRHEWFAEWGHRWLYLKRTGTADAVLSVEKGAAWQPTDALFPLPLAELQNNRSLVQNPGY